MRMKSVYKQTMNTKENHPVRSWCIWVRPVVVVILILSSVVLIPSSSIFNTYWSTAYAAFWRKIRVMF